MSLVHVLIPAGWFGSGARPAELRQLTEEQANREYGAAWLAVADCKYCQRPQRQCLTIDGSSTEYSASEICFECIDRLRRATGGGS